MEALRDPAADTDKNETVTALEAFNYANEKTAQFYETQKRLATEHPTLEDTGQGDGERKPSPENGEGLLAAHFTLLRFGSTQMAATTPEKKALLDKREDLEAADRQAEIRKGRAAARRVQEAARRFVARSWPKPKRSWTNEARWRWFVALAAAPAFGSDSGGMPRACAITANSAEAQTCFGRLANELRSLSARRRACGASRLTKKPTINSATSSKPIPRMRNTACAGAGCSWSASFTNEASGLFDEALKIDQEQCRRVSGHWRW